MNTHCFSRLSICMRFDSKIDEPEELSDHDRANRRLLGGIIISLLLHALALTLQFGIPGLDLPSFEVPWKERRTALEPLQVEIVTPNDQGAKLPPVPAVTSPELFKLPEPVLPPPVPKVASTPVNGIVLVAPRPPVKLEEVKISTNAQKVPKTKINPSAPPVVKRVPPPPAAPTRIIAQERVMVEDFVVPLASNEETERKAEDKKEQKGKLEAIPADALIDKDAETQLIEEQKHAELVAKKLKEELLQKKLEEQKIAEQKRQEQQKLAQEQALADSLRQQAEREALKKQELEKIALETVKRERERALEEASKEARKQELLTQETLKQEEQRRQAEQQRLRQLALEQEQQKQVALAQAQQKQKQLEEAEKQRALEVAERKRLEELAAQKLAAQQLLEQKLQEQKTLEKKLAEQKITEQKALEQKLVEQRLAEQKVAEQKATEQKIAEQKVAEREAALAAANARLNNGAANGVNNGANNSIANRAGNDNGTGSGNKTTARDVLSAESNRGDLASRLREQARSGDVFKSVAPNAKILDETNRNRRRSILGAYDKEVPLRMYVDSIKHKLERNGNLIYEKRSLSNIENNVLVNMVIRSDGTIEEVTILRTSGSRSIDEKARNIIMANAPYAVFPPTLAAKYDVIEVQRVWSFGDRLRILEELP